MWKKPSSNIDLEYLNPLNHSLEEIVLELKTKETAVHVWVVDKNDCQNQKLSSYLKLLSKEELIRRQKFHFKKDRSTFVLSRAILRLLLSFYTQIAPNKIVFDYGKFGKPKLRGDHKTKFNLSHSKEIIVLAFSLNEEIGIDTEYLNTQINHFMMAKTVFSKKETDFLITQPPHEQINCFYHLWTRKEALIKLMGYGLSMPIALTSISVLDGTVSVPMKHTAAKQNWDEEYYVKSFWAKKDYHFAIAMLKNIKNVHLMNWWDYNERL